MKFIFEVEIIDDEIEDFKKYFLTGEWVEENKDVITQNIFDILKGEDDFSRGDPTPWNEHSKMNKILEKIGATKQLTEALVK